MELSAPFIHRLVDLQRPGGVRISPTASHVVYHTSPLGRRGEHTKSTLWIAQVGAEHSARPLTSGLYNDRSPRWMPTGHSIVFISDRASPGKSCALYCLNLEGAADGEAYPLTPAENEKAIDRFEIEPRTGKFIAYISPDEDSAEKKRRNRDGDDAQVYGQDWEYNRLRLLHVSTGAVQHLYAESRHVSQLTWTYDSSGIVFLSRETPDPDEMRVRFSSILLSTRQMSHLCDFPGPVYGELCCDSSHLNFLAGKTPHSSCTSVKPYALPYMTGQWTRLDPPKLHGHDSVDYCVEDMVKASYGRVVKCAYNMETQLFFLGDSSVMPLMQRRSPISGFDFVIHNHLDSSLASVAGVAIIEGNTKHPNEVTAFCGTRDQYMRWGPSITLSNHGASIPERPFGSCFTFQTNLGPGADGPLGVLFTPKGVTFERVQKLPCVVLIHGGPYVRTPLSFDPNQKYWYPALANQGYAILSPDYSGSSGRGEVYAARARGSIGTRDYDDIIATVDEAVGKGWIDKDRLVVGGFSTGGFLSYLCATRNGRRQQPPVDRTMFKPEDVDEAVAGSFEDRSWVFKGAVCGAGVSDWDMLTMSTEAPTFDAELAGGAPWAMSKSDLSTRNASPIWEMSYARNEDVPPILILHGREDRRVPWTQALAYSRACRAKGIPCEFVTYPREGHTFKERAHLIDMCERVVRFVESRIG
ncbi:hypothetical protein FH972_024646 [Carpinus fangiana]|uniref:Peptidase S9 prolyl oligopeptidase catalytic domain-containing protein n=1 Tax=Carpinus fangiana TaxID=176857 RepID=A0A5N6KZA0_9ROSI|nr:hypothetical protein FH972_024646 [Carpinus fangiana]